VTIPQLQLKAFNKISIAAGKSEWIEFRLPIADLWLIDRSLQKVVEPGEFEILLGASSVDIRLQEIIAVHSGK
jgi:beta-glucosidase